MKSYLNILFALVILFQGMFLYVDISCETMELLEDYQIHKTKYGDDFETFLSKHFGKLRQKHQNQHKKEHQEHQHHNTNEVHIQLEFVCFNDIEIVPQKEIIFSKKNNFHYKDLFSSFEKQKIFQPPRFV